MSTRVKSVTPLAIAIGVVAFLWCEFALNFSFHWVTVADGVFGKFGLPEHFQLVLPASFVTWGLFYILGADRRALRNTLIAATTGSLAALVIMGLGPALSRAPHFWGIALAVGLAGAGLVLISTAVADGSLSPAPAFACGGTVLMWWIATGLDNYVADGKGPHTVTALAAALTKTPLAAGTGALGGLLSTPWPWVAVSVWVTLLCGVALGVISGALARALGRLTAPSIAASEPAPQ
jgi:hypothetical protein